MKSDIILAGVGGQGILTIAAAVGYAAMYENLYIKQAEVHGMSQRGGAVQSNLRISNHPIHSDLIPLGKADIILSVEPLEALRYLPYLAPNGWLITNEEPYKNIDNYPEINEIVTEIKKIPNHALIHAAQEAKKIGYPRASNIVMLGLAARLIEMKKESFEYGIKQLFKNKGDEVIRQNIKAFEIGGQHIQTIHPA